MNKQLFFTTMTAVAVGMCAASARGETAYMASDVKALLVEASNGDAVAQRRLGLCYGNGNGVEQDYTNAVKWFRKAAEQGDATAQFNVGLCYYRGEGVARDDAEAVKWHWKAAAQGNTAAQDFLRRRAVVNRVRCWFFATSAILVGVVALIAAWKCKCRGSSVK
jgi:TPR repeat protein